MLIQYKLTGDAKRRMFLDGVVPAQSQLLEVDPSGLAADAHLSLRTHGHLVTEGETKQLFVLDGAYNALTLDELLVELKTAKRSDGFQPS
jgi:hypothetical protein